MTAGEALDVTGNCCKISYVASGMRKCDNSCLPITLRASPTITESWEEQTFSVNYAPHYDDFKNPASLVRNTHNQRKILKTKIGN